MQDQIAVMTSSVPTGQSGTEDYFDINKFEELLNRLEASKGRQQRQKSLEGRRDIFAQGLASMMSNFWSWYNDFFCSYRSNNDRRLFWYQ